MDAHAPSLSPRALYDRLRCGEPVSILDVRDRDEFDEWHVDGPSVTARQVPYVQFVAANASGNPIEAVPDGLHEPIVVVCGRGEASNETAAMLQAEGIHAENLAGGMDAWADLLVAHELSDTPPGVDVVQYERPATGCLSYLVATGGECLVLDPLYAFAEEYVQEVADRGLEVRHVVDTHVHADHLSGVRALAERTGAAVVLPAGTTDRGLAFDASLVGDGDVLSLGDRALRVVNAPGHTSEHVVLDADSLLFTGDTLFLDGVGRPDLEDPDVAREHAELLYDTLHGTIFDYPEDTSIAPGHVQPHEIEGEGPYAEALGGVRDSLTLTALDEADFVERVAGDTPPRPANHERIIEYNLGHATLDQSALALELGPNNCAISGS